MTKTDFEKAAREQYPEYWEDAERYNAFLAGCEHAYSIDKWISVKDQLPELKQRVLIYRDIGPPGEIIATTWTAGDLVYMEMDAITHWQPLPEPPSTPDN